MKYVFLILFVSMYNFVFSQNCNLSVSEEKHWLKAVTFVEEATSNEDYLLAAKEFEQILISNASCPDVYYNLGLVYSKIVSSKGEFAINKAKEYFNYYLKFKPEESAAIEKELIIMEARLEKYNNDTKNNMLKDFEGTWEKYNYFNGRLLSASQMQININNSEVKISSHSLLKNISNIPGDTYYYNIQVHSTGISYTVNSNIYYPEPVNEEFGEYDKYTKVFSCFISLLSKTQIKEKCSGIKIQYYYHGRLIFEQNNSAISELIYDKTD